MSMMCELIEFPELAFYRETFFPVFFSVHLFFSIIIFSFQSRFSRKVAVLSVFISCLEIMFFAFLVSAFINKRARLLATRFFQDRLEATKFLFRLSN